MNELEKEKANKEDSQQGNVFACLWCINIVLVLNEGVNRVKDADHIFRSRL